MATGLRPRISFKLKLTLSYIFVVLFSFGLIAYFLDKNLEESYLNQIESSLLNQASLIESQINIANFRQGDRVYLDTILKSLSKKLDCRITFINAGGRVLADSEKPLTEVPDMESHAHRPEIEAALHGKQGKEIRYSATLGIEMLYVAEPLKDKDEIIGVTRLALPLESVQNSLLAVRKTILFALFFALGLAFILGSVLSASVMRRLQRIIQVSRKFSEGDFSKRILLDPRDEIGELAATLNRMAQDIEDKIKEVKVQHQELTAVLNSMIEGVVVLDRKTQIISINPTVERIFAVTQEAAKGKFFLEAIRNNDISEIISEVLDKGEFVSGELNLMWPVRKIFEVNASPIFEKSTVNGCLIVIHDITEVRRLEIVRSDFVANVSHELKTPLTSIKGFVETLLEGAIDDKKNSRHFLEIIRNHSDRLSNLIDDLLDLSRIESKEMKLEIRQLNPRDLVEEAMLGFGSQLKKKGIVVENNLSPDSSVKGDKDKIEQVLINLIDNAIKFNKESGSIKIYSEPLDDRVKFFIEDSGLGIPSKDLPRIFERFYRADKARSRELGGTGLGLSIVKHIIELHGGSVGVESIEGFGSKFWFILSK